MSNLTDFVIANDNEGSAIGESDHPAAQWPTLETKGVDTVKLATLVSAITGQSDTAAIRRRCTFAGGDEEIGPWVFKLPPDIVDCIAKLPSENVETVAAKWAATEEMQSDRWSAIDVAALVVQLQQHANKAKTADATMFLWVSL
jgi:hypothetical protein